MPIVSAFRRILVLIGVALTALFSPALLAQSSGGSPAADGFDPNAINGSVIAMTVQTDGRILIAGTFTELRPKGTLTSIGRPRIARLYPDGTVDASFYADVNDQINVMTLDGDGNIYIGGRFTQVTGPEAGGKTWTRNHFAKLDNTGKVDTTWDPNTGVGTYNDVTSFAWQNGKLIAGGGFTALQPNGGALQQINHIVRFNADGTIDPTFKASVDGYVMSMVVKDTVLIIGGSFKTVKNWTTDPKDITKITSTTSTAQGYLARLLINTAGKDDGTIDPSFAPVLDNSINAVVQQVDGQLLIGGNFTSVNGDTGRVHFTRLNYGKQIVKDQGPVDGSIDTSFAGTTDGGVSSILVAQDGRILVTGAFSTVSGSSHSYVARVLPGGAADNTFSPGPNAVVYTMAEEANGSILLGGAFTTLRGFGATSVTRNHLARVTQLGSLDTDFRPDLNGRLRTVYAQKDGKLLVGGSFTSVAGATHYGIVRLNSDGSVDASFTTQLNGAVTAIMEQADGQYLLIGGSFSEVNGASRAYIARLDIKDGSLVTAFNPTLDGQVNAMVQQADGKVVFGGAFTSIVGYGSTDTVARSGMARFSLDGTLDTNYNPYMNSTVYALLLQSDGMIVAGGSFTSATPNGASTATARYGIARFKTDGSLDGGFSPSVNGTVYALGLQTDGSIVIGGSFHQISTTVALYNWYNIVRVSSSGVVDTTFNPMPNGSVVSILVQSDDSMEFGGFFTALAPNTGTTTTTNSTTGATTTTAGPGSSTPTNAVYIARLKKEATVDAGFDLGFDQVAGNQVSSIVAAGSQIVIGGAFAAAGPISGPLTPVRRLVRVDTTGKIDPTFTDLSTAKGATINAIATELNGSMMVAGTFTDIGGTRSSNLAWFYADGTPVTSFAPYIQQKGASGTPVVKSLGEYVNKGAVIPTQRTGLARLDTSGNLYPSFAIGDQLVSGTFNAIAVDGNNNLLVGGSMLLSGDTNAGVQRLKPDGTVDATYTDLGLEIIYTIVVQPDGKILVGGSFSYSVTNSDSTTTYYTNLLRLNPDGLMDTTFKPNPNGTVQTILLQSDGSMVIGGSFTTIYPVGASASTTRDYIARLAKDGTPDTTFNPTANAAVNAIYALPGGKYLVGGNFTTFAPNGASTTTTRSYLAVIKTDGTLDSTDFGMNGAVAAITGQTDGSILIGGSFSTILSTTRNNVVRLTSALAIDATFNPNTNGYVQTIAIQPAVTGANAAPERILLGGAFTAVTPNGTAIDDPMTATPRNHIARFNLDGTLDASFNPNFDSTVTLIVPYAGTLLVAGSFSTIQPTGSLLIGGLFDTINSVAVSNLALFSTDGSISSAFQPNPHGEVDAILPLTDDRLIVAGAFTQFDGLAGKPKSGHIARFLADNSLDTTYNPNADGNVDAVAQQDDGKLIVGGEFNAIGGGSQPKLARLNQDGTLDTTFTPTVSGTVHTVAIQADGKVLAVYDNGATPTGSVLQRFKADTGAVDMTVSGLSDGAKIDTISLQVDGKILVGGLFTKIGGGNAQNFARLNSDGTLDTTLTASPNGEVTSLAITAEGKVVIGGTFTTVDSLARFGLARLAPPALTDVPKSTFTLDIDRTQVTWTRTGVAPEMHAVVVETGFDAVNFQIQGQAARVLDGNKIGTPNWTLTGVNLSATGGFYIRTRMVVPGTPGTSSGQSSSWGWTYLAPVPVVTGPTAVTAVANASFSYAITASNYPTTYSSTDLPEGLTLDPHTGVITGQIATTGKVTFHVIASNVYGDSQPVEITVTVKPTGGTPDPSNPRLVNISVRGHSVPGFPLIGGFVIGGGPLSVYTRAIGPSLKGLGFADGTYLPNPRLQLVTLSGLKLRDATYWYQAANNDAFGSVATQIHGLDSRLGATPPLAWGVNDSGYLSTLDSGPYCILVDDWTAGTGTALAEIYDASVTPVATDAPQLMNLSARGQVISPDFLVGGFVISGDSNGNKKMRVLIRGIGQTLATMGVTDGITDTNLIVYQTVGGGQPSQQIASNDNWGDSINNKPISDAAKTVGAFSLADGSKDAAVLLDLKPGIYTVEVHGPSGTTGEVMVEIYKVLITN